MTDFKVIKSADGCILHSVILNGLPYTAQDVFYTISQNYKEVLIADNVYISSNFPYSTTVFSSEDKDTDICSLLEEMGCDLYFDADGIFVFCSMEAGSVERAAEEFKKLYDSDQLIFGPTLVSYPITADSVICIEGLGNRKVLYLYSN